MLLRGYTVLLRGRTKRLRGTMMLLRGITMLLRSNTLLLRGSTLLLRGNTKRLRSNTLLWRSNTKRLHVYSNRTLATSGPRYLHRIADGDPGARLGLSSRIEKTAHKTVCRDGSLFSVRTAHPAHAAQPSRPAQTRARTHLFFLPPQHTRPRRR